MNEGSRQLIWEIQLKMSRTMDSPNYEDQGVNYYIK